MTLGLIALLLAAVAADPVSVVLNSPEAVSPGAYARAMAAVEREARAGKPLEQMVVAVKTRDRQLADRYYREAKEAIERLASEKDDPTAWYLLAIKNNNMRQLTHAAKIGSVQALNELGMIGVQKAMENAATLSTNEFARALNTSFAYFAQAATMRDPNALINLGTCYQRGMGCDQDFALAFECFRSAADAGHPDGMNYMAACYEFGHGVAKDADRARYWRMRAKAARGDKDAAEWLVTRKDK